MKKKIAPEMTAEPIHHSSAPGSFGIRIDALATAATQAANEQRARKGERQHLHREVQRVAAAHEARHRIVEQQHQANDDAALVREEAGDVEQERCPVPPGMAVFTLDVEVE
jgi:hypothetical protein